MSSTAPSSTSSSSKGSDLTALVSQVDELFRQAEQLHARLESCSDDEKEDTEQQLQAVLNDLHQTANKARGPIGE